ncbi:MAG: FAD-dependent oxidoreductase [Deltaproteobacteria bacterium]|nr:FAD-dependent oxidoreductase [Deltaproteobacteria bacterium]MBW1962356.1 FAD-dependent oxidoreductase [Deltaproteobacteria bacterium]MBW2151667.1 FAD-dependent oxidoreductase [Deltaproteobacteria bacterium]
MLTAIVLMGGMGILIGTLLAMASKIFYVYVDPKVEAVEMALPGANCGGCGLPGCSANAEAIVAGKASPSSCVAGGAEIAEAIAAIMGVSVEAREPDIARPGCYFGLQGRQHADLHYLYDGVKDCRAVAALGGGMKVCRIGCLGLGTCAASCPFDAISMSPAGLPVVDEVKCTGCGTCERVCPKHIIKLSSVTRRIIREYTIDDCTTPCQRACPAGIDIREYIRQINLGDYHRSVQVIKERLPFPTVIGRICPRPCELECRRNYVDEPVAINFLKRFVADYEKSTGKRVLAYKAPDTDRKIAVIGGGVEGLSTAYFAARLGHSPTVYEATAHLGGLLRSAIALDRLPREVLDWDIDGILEMGVKAETNKVLGADFTICSLLEQGFEAVFLATGGWDSRLARHGGSKIESPIPGTYLLLDLLRSESTKQSAVSIGKNVVISGGGKLALDAARICKGRGAKTITILYRESLEDSPITDADVKAYGDKLDILFNVGINRLYGEKDRLTELEYIDLDTKTPHTITAETLIIASGRFPEIIFTPVRREFKEPAESPSLEVPPRWEAKGPYKAPAFRNEVGLLSEGDTLSDFSAAVKAIGAGRRAAAAIHQMMYGLDPILPEDVVTPTTPIQDVDHVEQVESIHRHIMPLCRAQDEEECPEREKGFTEQTAKSEASRCLQCGLVCYERKWDEQSYEIRQIA